MNNNKLLNKLNKSLLQTEFRLLKEFLFRGLKEETLKQIDLDIEKSKYNIQVLNNLKKEILNENINLI